MNIHILKVKHKRVKLYAWHTHRVIKALASLFLFSALTACTTTPWQLASVDTIRTTITTQSSTLPAYDLTAAEWVPNQPLLVNKDFNFGMAMSMEGVGVAIAAGMRINKNKELAQTLSTMPPLMLDQRWQEAAGPVKGSLRGSSVLIYAMLCGQPQAQLRTIVEFHNEKEPAPPLRYMDYSDWAPIAGTDSWTANNGGNIAQQSQQSITAIVSLLSKDLVVSAPEIDYTIIGGEAVQRGSGFVVSQDDQHIVIKSTTIPNTVLRIPSAHFKQMEKILEPMLEE